MIKRLRIELLYFFGLLLVLALVQHPDLLSSPLQRVQNMINSSNYIHPLLWTFVLYFIIAIVRIIVATIQRFKNRKSI
jgi:ABC-type multidrug transport system fused ATPase/permease subunit